MAHWSHLVCFSNFKVFWTAGATLLVVLIATAIIIWQRWFNKGKFVRCLFNCFSFSPLLYFISFWLFFVNFFSFFKLKGWIAIRNRLYLAIGMVIAVYNLSLSPHSHSIAYTCPNPKATSIFVERFIFSISSCFFVVICLWLAKNELHIFTRLPHMHETLFVVLIIIGGFS